MLENTLHVVLYQFNFEMQFLLDEFMQGKIEFKILIEECNLIDIEFSPTDKIYAYKKFLEFLRENKHRIKLHAGLIPAVYVQDAIERGRHALHAVRRRDYIKKDEDCDGTEEQYSAFASYITDQPFENDPKKNPPVDSHRKSFAAKVIRDCSIAHKVNRILDPEDTGIRPSDSVMVICAFEHLAFGFGIPERIQDHDITKAFRD